MLNNVLKTLKIRSPLEILRYSRTQSLLVDSGVDQFEILLLDLSELEAMDSSGMGALLALQESFNQQGKEIALISPSPSFVKLLCLLELENTLWIYESKEAAVKELLPITSMGVPEVDDRVISPWKSIFETLKRSGRLYN